jgi:hypothetical protein
MAKSNTEIPSNFIEDDYISAIDRILGKASGISPNIEISRISQQDEGDLGYDGILNSIVPYYIQFKVPTYFTPKYSGKLKLDRESLGKKDVNGFLGFKLRLDPKSSKFDQHNALFKLSKKQEAVYVSPKFYKKKHLSILKKEQFIYPWDYDDVVIIDPYYSHQFRRRLFKNIKLFSSSITIPIHKEITDKAKSHSFSFNLLNETIFHSEPETLEGEPVMNLSEYLYQIVNQEIESRENPDSNLEAFPNNIILDIPEIFDLPWRSPILREIFHSELLFLGIKFSKSNPLETELVNLDLNEKLILLEIVLEKYFNIHQYLILKYNF